MKKLILGLLLGTATNAFACEWKLTVTNLMTNELKYYKVDVGEMQYVQLQDPVNEKAIDCVYSLESMPAGGDIEKHVQSFTGCMVGEYMTMSKGVRAEFKNGHIEESFSFYLVTSLESGTPLYQLGLACE